MKIGDLVKIGGKKLGIVTDIDPLREDSLYEYDKINEIVVLRDDGAEWYMSPKQIEVISESR